MSITNGRTRRMGMVAALGPVLLVGSLAAQTHQTVVEVPLSVDHGVLAAPVQTVAGETLRFQVNPGSGTTMLSASTAARLGTEPGLTLGGIPVDAPLTRPDADLIQAGVSFDGIVGADVLSEFDVLFDGPAGRMLLREVGPVRIWEGVALSDPVRLTVLHGVILTLEVGLGGHRWPAMLAMAGPATVASPAVGEALGLQGVGYADLELGHAAFSDVPVEVEDMEIFRRFRPDGSGFVLVGSALAETCPVALSWAHREIRTCIR